MTHVEILRTFNDWRRDRTGNLTLEDFGITPRMIGEALDAVIKDAERWEYAYRHDVDLGIHSDCYVDDLISCEKRLRQ